jgi:hypothetical protein
MRTVSAGLVLVALGGAFLAGYWPQRAALARTNEQLAEARRLQADAESRAAAADAQLRLARIFGQLLALQDAVATGNYGEAQAVSSRLFDRVRELAAAAEDATARAALESVLARRDTVTAGLARREGSVQDVLLPIERELREALGYPVPAPAGAQPTATAPPAPALPSGR